MYHFECKNSSLVSEVTYDKEKQEMTFIFPKYFTDKLTYRGVPYDYFEELKNAKSVGKFYLTMIKPNFLLIKQPIMANSKKSAAAEPAKKPQPKGVNNAKNSKRFIKMRINVAEIEKDWITVGEKGRYLDITLQMLPDGTVDRFENLGMITQDVPKEIYEKEKDLPASKRTNGPILGNGKELEWNASSGAEGAVGTQLDRASQEELDDLPF